MRVLRRRVLAGLLGVVVAACGGDGPTTPPPPPPPPPPPAPTITLAPASLSVEVGQSGTFTATINNGTGTITWTSSAPAVATVDQTGLVTGVTPGNATVTAALTGQSGVSASAPVTVTAPVLGITVVGVTQNGQPVPLAALTGVVNVEVDIDAPATFNGTADVLFDDVVVGSLALVNGVPEGSAGLGRTEAPLELAIRSQVSIEANTRLVVVDQDALTALPLTPNGDFAAIVRLLPTGGQTVSEQSVGQVTLANTRGVAITSHQLEGPTVQDPGAGTTWGMEGRFTATPVFFDGSTPSASQLGVTLKPVDPLNPGANITYSGAPVGGVINVVLRKDKAPGEGGAAGIEGRYQATDASMDGQPVDLLNLDPQVGNALADIFFPLDNKGPEITGNPTFEAGSSTAWLNRNDLLFDRFKESGWQLLNDVRDRGIGNVTCQLRYTTDGGSTFNGPVETGDDVGFETPSASLSFKLECFDLMVNLSERFVTDGQGTTPQNVGMDFTNPKAWFDPSRNGVQGLVTGARNPAVGTPVFLGSSDLNGSGFGQNPYLLTGTRYAPGLTTVADQCVIGTPNGECAPLELAQDEFNWNFSSIIAGQFQLKYQARDQARNLSDPVTLGAFNDIINPVVANLDAPASFTAGLEFTVGFTFTDEQEVATVAGGFVFENTPRIPVLRYTRPGTPFDDQFATSVPTSYTLPFYLHLETLVDAGGFDKPSGVGIPARYVIVGGTDFGGNVGESRVDLSGKVTGAFETFNVGPENFSFNLPEVRLCYNPFGSNGDCGGIPEQQQVSLNYFAPPGGVNLIDNVRLTKLSTNAEGLATALALEVLMSPTEQTFSGFSQFTHTGVLRGSDFHSAGNYELGWFGFRTGGGTLLDGSKTRIPLEVVRATPIGW